MSLESILIALIAAAPGLFALIGTLKKDSAEASKTRSEREQLEDEITARVLQRARSEIDALHAELEREREARRDLEQRHIGVLERVRLLESEREEWKIGIGLLLGQLINAKIEPTWKPSGVEVTISRGDVS